MAEPQAACSTPGVARISSRMASVQGLASISSTLSLSTPMPWPSANTVWRVMVTANRIRPTSTANWTTTSAWRTTPPAPVETSPPLSTAAGRKAESTRAG